MNAPPNGISSSLVGLDVAQPGDALVRARALEERVDDVRRLELDVLLLAGALEHDLRGAELGAAVDRR